MSRNPSRGFMSARHAAKAGHLATGDGFAAVPNAWCILGRYVTTSAIGSPSTS